MYGYSPDMFGFGFSCSFVRVWYVSSPLGHDHGQALSCTIRTRTHVSLHVHVYTHTYTYTHTCTRTHRWKNRFQFAVDGEGNAVEWSVGQLLQHKATVHSTYPFRLDHFGYQVKRARVLLLGCDLTFYLLATSKISL